MTLLSRRFVLKVIGLTHTWLGLNLTSASAADNGSSALSATSAPKDQTVVSFDQTHDRVWLSADCWANPMEDWRVVDGAAETVFAGRNRNVHLVTHQLTNPDQTFEMSVVLSQVGESVKGNGVGFKVGVRSDLNEYRSNCFANSGIIAGIVQGQLVLGNATKAFDELIEPKNVKLVVSGKPVGEGGRYELTLVATAQSGTEIGRISEVVDPNKILGNVAIFTNYAKGKLKGKRKSAEGGRYRFNNWTVDGAAFTVTDENRFGPILWSMYSLSNSRTSEGFVMKMTALTGPLGADDNHDVELFVNEGESWKSLGSATLDPDSWTATFRIPNWDETTETPYRLVYREQRRDGTEEESEWSGSVNSNPSGRPLRLAGLTCQKDYGFPYQPVAENLIKLDPDMLYFSGDQIYEDHGGFGGIRDPADRSILNYLRKYYMHGWAFRHAMKNAPTLCLPDDHDVFQGNIWGGSGAAMKVAVNDASSHGGYRQSARMVNAVHRTTVGHHPDAYDPTPIQQGIGVYFGDMVYGDVSFAIIADRQFKSGPEHVDTGGARADHVPDKDFDTAALDKPGLIMLGERQEDFLRSWSDDWRGHTMKVLLSQTVFAGVATHHGSIDGYLKGDLDSGAWPQTARDNAITSFRSAKPLHLNGDQHLTSLSQYGVAQQRDSAWSFCTPAISAGYPRWWLPDEVGMPHKNRPKHGLPNTGEYTDGFGNLVYVYAVGNPEVGTKKHRYELAHQKGSGFGLITIDGEAKIYRIEAFRFLVDATDGKASNQFPGFPVTIHQQENVGENQIQ